MTSLIVAPLPVSTTTKCAFRCHFSVQIDLIIAVWLFANTPAKVTTRSTALTSGDKVESRFVTAVFNDDIAIIVRQQQRIAPFDFGFAQNPVVHAQQLGVVRIGNF